MKKLLLLAAVVALAATGFTLTAAADQDKAEKRERDREQPKAQRDLPPKEHEKRAHDEQRKRALLEELKRRRAENERAAVRESAENEEAIARRRAMAKDMQERLRRSREHGEREHGEREHAEREGAEARSHRDRERREGEEHHRGREPRRVSLEEAERQMHHLREASELLGAIGRADLARQLGNEARQIAEKIERHEREQGERHEGPNTRELAGGLERLQDHVMHLTRKVEELERRLNSHGKERR